MKWLAAVGGLIVGAFISPVAAFIMAVAGWFVGGAMSKSAAPAKDETPTVDPEDVAALRRQVQKLGQRVSELESQVAQLARGMVPGAPPASAAAATAATPTATEKPAAPATPVRPEPAEESRLTLPSEGKPATAPLVITPAPVARVPVAPAAVSSAAPASTAQPIEAASLSPTPTAASSAASAAPGPRPAFTPAPPAAPEPSLIERLPAPMREFLLGGNTLVKVGVVLLFLGLAFLLRYAAERTTVPIPLRYAGVAGLGAALLAVGWWLRERRQAYALILQGAGIGVFYLTTLAAMKLHPLIEPSVGFAFLLAVTVLSGVLAVLQNAQALAVVAALEGFAAPVLVSTGSTSPVGLFTYLTVLNLGIAGMAWFKAWRPLHLIALVGTLTLSGAWAQARYTPDHYAVTQAFLLLFGVLFSGIGLMFARRSLLDGGVDATASLGQRAGQALLRVGRVDSALVFGAPVSAFALQYLLVREMPLGPALAAVGFGLFHLLLARLALAQRQPGLMLLAEAYVIVAVLFGTLAIPLGLEGRWTGAAWAVEAAGMFWLGLRQQRPYARVFALAVLGGATWKLLGEMSLSLNPNAPWLQGSTLGPVLLAASCAMVLWLAHQQGEADVEPEGSPGEPLATLPVLEATGLAALPWLAVGALNLLPWIWLTPIWAPAGTAALGLALYIAAQRWAYEPLRPVVLALQGLAVLGLLAAVQPAATESGAVLADGWQALASAVFIALSLITTAWLAARPTWLDAKARGLPPDWSFTQQASMVTGAALLHLAVLFVAPWPTVAWAWPLMALLTLWAGARGVLTPLVALSGGVQVAAAGVGLALSLNKVSGWEAWYSGAAFMSVQFFATLLQAVVALASLSLLHSVAQQRQREQANGSSRMLLPLAWCESGLMRWAPLVAGLVWWLWAWAPEISNALQRAGQEHLLLGSLIGLLLLSALLMRAIAQRRQWPEMGAATLAVLPLLALLASADCALQAWRREPWLPSEHLGWLAWPLALGWHLFSLKRWSAEWPGQRLATAWHPLGLWLFTALAAQELSSHLSRWAAPGSAWAMLGGVAVVAAVLWALSHPALARRWPLAAHPRAYLQVGATPLALWSLAWLWASNVWSAGDAAPLPVIPLLNPLEMGHALVLMALLLWQRALPEDSPLRLEGRAQVAVWGSTGLALLTGAVLRACHHLAGIPWEMSALMGSTLAQAALSITWALTGVVVMVLGNRRGSRGAWVAGAALLAVVVVKLFFVELADSGGLYRIVSFMGVGALLLLVGYFAPVPSTQKEEPEAT
ncbi:DUF2339 domain-containing protein [Ideonella sp.]|uniref:DUF2339 domain-containing protein n=1 Tax=Ideonella sp. TaxID=1929293 RepID=UPI0037BEFE67